MAETVPKSKPDIMEKESQVIEYTPEELKNVQEFFTYFDRAPGQIDVPAEFEEIPSETPEKEEPLSVKDEEFVHIEPGSLPPIDDLGGDLDGGALTGEDLSGLDNLGVPPELSGTKEESAIPSLDDLSPYVTFTKESIPSPPETGYPATTAPESGVQFSDEQIKDIHQKLKAYPLPIRKLAINSIIEDKLSPENIADIVAKINKEASTDEIKKFLESKLGIELGNIQKDKKDKTQVFVSRLDYTDEGLEKRGKRLRRLQIGALIAIILFMVGAASYHYIFKPWFYRGLIADGKEIILKNAPNPPSLADIQEAEKNFKKVLTYYPKEINGYLQYADAYSKVGLYENAFEKLFGKVVFVAPFRLKNEYITSSDQFWRKIKDVPTVGYSNDTKNQLRINGSFWNLEKKGVYLTSHLDEKEVNAMVLLALGKFHSNPAKRFRRSSYRNNLLGIGYFKRILTFETKSPLFRKDSYLSKALQGIGNVYYRQKDYFKSNEYFEKSITNQPNDPFGHAGVLRNLLRLYKKQRDPRLIIDYHNKVKYSLDIEDGLPLDVLAKLAAFYIDLPEEDDLRVKYNVSAKDFVNAHALKQRAYELLNLLYSKDEKDEYGNIKQGKYLAEGFYQRGRYYYKVMNRPRVAMKQFEYAYKYDPRHFLALNDRAEILLSIHDYGGAIKNLDLAIQQLSPEKVGLLGDFPEDETLVQADIGRVYFNYGRAIYLSIVEKMGETNDWQRIQELEKYKTESGLGIEPLVATLDKADIYFSKGDEIGLKDERQRTKLLYYQGWSSYVKGNHKKALFLWESIPPEWQMKYRNLELAKSHALYKLATVGRREIQKNLQAALTYLLFLQSYYQKQASQIEEPSVGNKTHVKLFTRLVMIENNLGAIYELFQDENKSTQHYWRSIDYSKRILRENEVARYNLKLSFKRTGLEKKEAIPVIMDFIPPTLKETL